MRRLLSHIALAATSLLMVGATFSAVITSNNFNSNIEYESGMEMVFRIYNDEDDDGNPDKDFEFTTKDAVNNIAEKMESRLKNTEVSRYKIETQGYDTIKVTFETDQSYEFIKNYLMFDSTLAISNSKETVAYADEFLNKNKKAYLEITDGYPAIVIPINEDNEAFKAVYDEAHQMSEDGTGEVEEETGEETEEGEKEHVHRALLYLWYNYVKDYYSYSKYKEGVANIADKVLMSFDASMPFYSEDDHSALKAYIRGNNTDESSVTADDLKDAYQNARYYVNLLNAGELDYYVEFLFANNTSAAWVEELVALGNHETVAWSMTFIATLCAIVVVSLLLIYFYRLGASSIATVSIVTTFLGFLFIVLFNAEFNIAGIIGLIALAFTSILSGVIYANKLKEECYRGRSLKKANAEAAKKALLPTIDLHVILVIVGVACYLLGGVIMKGFALATILGGLASLVLNLAGLRGLMWLVTNEQALANRYDLFDVSSDQVPNALEEERQTYYGANADRDFTKHKKPIALVAIIMLVASVTGAIVWGIKDKGAVYSTGQTSGNSQLYVEYSSESQSEALKIETKNRLDKMLEYSYLGKEKLKDIVEVEPYEWTAKSETTLSGIETVYYAYYRVNFDRIIKDNDQIVYDEKDADGTQVKLIEAQDAKDYFDATTSNALAYLGFDAKVNIALKDSVRVSADQPEFKWLILSTSVAAAAITLYLLLRYRLSRGLAALGIAVVNVGITAGIFSLLHFLPVTSYVSVALPFVALFSFAIGVIYMNKEREMVLEDRSRDNSVENRNTMMVKAIGMASTPITIGFIIALYLGVNFFGFMITSVSWIFLLIILGVSISTALTLTVFGPLAQLLFKWFAGINLPRPNLNKKKKARPTRVKKSAEPEEAIFIGIND